jgi:hypothetical protein
MTPAASADSHEPLSVEALEAATDHYIHVLEEIQDEEPEPPQAQNRAFTEPDERPPSAAPFGYTPRRLLLVLLVLAIGGLYLSGRLDHLLYNVGLNYNQCARNGFGAVFCGKELTEYGERVSGAEREGKEAGAKIEHESQEAERQAQESIERSEREAQSHASPSEEGTG